MRLQGNRKNKNKNTAWNTGGIRGQGDQWGTSSNSSPPWHIFRSQEALLVYTLAFCIKNKTKQQDLQTSPDFVMGTSPCNSDYTYINLARLFQLSSPLPSFWKDGANNTLGTDMSCLSVWNSTVRLIWVVGLRFCQNKYWKIFAIFAFVKKKSQLPWLRWSTITLHCHGELDGI